MAETSPFSFLSPRSGINHTFPLEIVQKILLEVVDTVDEASSDGQMFPRRTKHSLKPAAKTLALVCKRWGHFVCYSNARGIFWVTSIRLHSGASVSSHAQLRDAETLLLFFAEQPNSDLDVLVHHECTERELGLDLVGVLAVLEKNSHRWRSITLVSGVWRPLVSLARHLCMFHQKTLPRLEVLSIRLNHISYVDIHQSETKDFCPWTAPRLKHFSVHDIDIRKINRSILLSEPHMEVIFDHHTWYNLFFGVYDKPWRSFTLRASSRSVMIHVPSPHFGPKLSVLNLELVAPSFVCWKSFGYIATDEVNILDLRCLKYTSFGQDELGSRANFLNLTNLSIHNCDEYTINQLARSTFPTLHVLHISDSDSLVGYFDENWRVQVPQLREMTLTCRGRPPHFFLRLMDAPLLHSLKVHSAVDDDRFLDDEGVTCLTNVEELCYDYRRVTEAFSTTIRYPRSAVPYHRFPKLKILDVFTGAKRQQAFYSAIGSITDDDLPGLREVGFGANWTQKSFDRVLGIASHLKDLGRPLDVVSMRRNKLITEERIATLRECVKEVRCVDTLPAELADADV